MEPSSSSIGTTKEGENMLWGEDNTSETKKEEQQEKGSVVACDFYNSGGLMNLSDEDIVALLMGRRPGNTPLL